MLGLCEKTSAARGSQILIRTTFLLRQFLFSILLRICAKFCINIETDLRGIALRKQKLKIRITQGGTIRPWCYRSDHIAELVQYGIRQQKCKNFLIKRLTPLSGYPNLRNCLGRFSFILPVFGNCVIGTNNTKNSCKVSDRSVEGNTSYTLHPLLMEKYTKF